MDPTMNGYYLLTVYCNHSSKKSVPQVDPKLKRNAVEPEETNVKSR